MFCAQHLQNDWHQRHGLAPHADVIMGRIIHNTVWIDTGAHTIRERTVLVDA